MISKPTLYEELELLPANSLRPSLAARWRYIAQRLQDALTFSSDPVIRSRYTDGQLRFDVYDRSTNQRLSGLSDAEVRVWIEQRYRG